MEQVEQGAGDQQPQERSETWEALQQSQQPPEPVSRSSRSRQDAADGSAALQFQHTLPTPSPPSGGSLDPETSLEHHLVVLGAAARALAAAEGADILPLALHTFLALCRASRGFVLIRSEAAAGCQVAATLQTPERLAEWFAQEPSLCGASLTEGVAFLAANNEADGAAAEPQARESLARHLADAGVSWYARLPLALAEGGAAVLVALGEGDAPGAAERGRVCLAAALLSDLVIAALERAHLRQSLGQKERDHDEFIGLASHELKSPLTVIKGYSQLLLRQARRATNAGDIDLGGLEAINQQVSRMSNLVGELLDYSRIERGSLEVDLGPMDVIALARRVVEQRQRALPDMTFHLVTKESALLVLADHSRLEQALGYLLDNAVKFGQDGGMVEVTVQRVLASALPDPLAAGSAEGAGASPESEVALISVRDYGPGLPGEERHRLFSAFYRGPEHTFQRELAGLGLGLYLSHYLVARQNGWLWADFPVAGQKTGSIFYLGLPLSPAA